MSPKPPQSLPKASQSLPKASTEPPRASPKLSQSLPSASPELPQSQNLPKAFPKTTQTTSKLLPNYLQATSWRRLLASRCHSYWNSKTNGIWGDFWRPDAIRIGARRRMASGGCKIAKSTRQKCIPYSTSATWTPQKGSMYGKVLFRGCKSAIRYCKSAISRCQKCYKVCTFRNIDGHHYRLIWIWGGKNTIRMPLFC